MNHIGNHLREIRKNWGKTLKDVSEYCGVSIDYLSKVEKGDRVPTDQLLTDISKFFTIPFQELNELRISDELVRLLCEVDNEKKVLKTVRKRLKNPELSIHISNSNPLKKETPKRKYVKGSKRGKVKGLNFYIQSNGKLKMRERKELIEKSEVYMVPITGGELDSSLTDDELLNEWNEFYEKYGMRIPDLKEQWMKDHPVPDEMDEPQNERLESNKLELPDWWKNRINRDSDLG